MAKKSHYTPRFYSEKFQFAFLDKTVRQFEGTFHWLSTVFPDFSRTWSIRVVIQRITRIPAAVSRLLPRPVCIMDCDSGEEFPCPYLRFFFLYLFPRHAVPPISSFASLCIVTLFRFVVWRVSATGSMDQGGFWVTKGLRASAIQVKQERGHLLEVS